MAQDINPTDQGTPPVSAIARLLGYTGIQLLLGIVMIMLAAVIAGTISHPIRGNDTGLRSVLAGIVVALVFIAAYAGFCRWIERRPAAEFALPAAGRELLVGLLLGAGLFSAVVGVIALAGGYRVVGTYSPDVMLPILGMAIRSGFSEEIALRGIIFRLMEKWVGSWGALAFSAALFGALHLANPNASLIAGTAIALEAGIMLAALYMVTRRLWAAIGLHAAWNFSQGGIYGIAVSGFAEPGLLVPRIAGPDWLTGGAFGAEASLPAVVICTLFGILLLVIAHWRGQFRPPAWLARRQGALAQP
jgi:membrane protease YdiL (CAAX protease family)